MDRQYIENPQTMDFPALEEIMPCKNHENWFMSAEDDTNEQAVREWCEIRECPFGDYCQHHNWNGASVWSMDSPQMCLRYAMQHGTHSTKHMLDGETLSNEVAYERLKEAFPNLNWKLNDETFQHRSEYRAWVQQKQKEPEQKPRAPFPSSKRARRGGGGDSVAPGDSASQVGGGAASQIGGGGGGDAVGSIGLEIAQAVMRGLQGFVGGTGGGNQHDGGKGGGPPFSDSSSAAHWGPPTHPSLTDGSPGRLFNVEPTVEVPIEKLKHIQDSLERSEHAMSGALKNTVEMCNHLASEREILQSSIRLISRFSGQRPNFFG